MLTFYLPMELQAPPTSILLCAQAAGWYGQTAWMGSFSSAFQVGLVNKEQQQRQKEGGE